MALRHLPLDGVVCGGVKRLSINQMACGGSYQEHQQRLAGAFPTFSVEI